MNTLLYKTVWESFEIEQNSSHEYIIKGSSSSGEQCLIKQQDSNKWLLTFNGTPKSMLNTKTVVQILKNADIMLV